MNDNVKQIKQDLFQHDNVQCTSHCKVKTNKAKYVDTSTKRN